MPKSRRLSKIFAYLSVPCTFPNPYGLVITCLLVAVRANISHAQQELLTAREMGLTSVQYDELKKDLPVQDIGFTDPSHLWILGQTSLWQWNLSTKRLSQIKLPTKLPLKHLLTEDTVYVCDDTALYSVLSDPLKVLKFPLEENLQGQSIGLQQWGAQTFWLRSDGIYVISEHDKNLVKVHSHSFQPQIASYQNMPQNQTLWISQKTTLFQFPYRTAKMKLIANLQDPIIHFQSLDNELYALTPHAILRLSPEGQLLQTIPVEGKREIVLARFNTDAHLFLFNDQILEMKIPSLKETLYYSMNVDLSRAKQMRFHGSFLAIVMDGISRVFQLSSGRPS